MSISSRILALSFAACLAGAATVHAQGANDDFTNATANGSGTVVTGAPGTYTVFNSNTLSVQDDAGGIGSGNALLSTPTAAFSKFFTNFGEITLTAANPTITLNFDLRYTSQPVNNFAQLRFGFFNQLGASFTDNDGDGGYFLQTNPGANTATGSNFVRDSGTSGGPLGGGAAPGDNLTFGSGFNSINLGTSPVNVTFSISLTDGGLNFNASFVSATGSTASGTAILNSSDVIGATFDTFVIGQGNFSTGPQPFLIDNVNISVVPEPGTWALMVAGAACLVAMQVRRGRGRS